jgi:L-amino acid N-acyltransferase YncA
MNTVIREATPGDEWRMAEIHVAAWRSAYAGIMPQEQLDSLDTQQKVDQWRHALEQAGKGVYLVAVVDGTVEGFAVFGPARDQDLNDAQAVEIVSININPSAWRTGVGTALIQAMFRRFDTDGYRYAYLWVATQNTRARSFYKRHGFSREGSVKADSKHSMIEELRFVRGGTFG